MDNVLVVPGGEDAYETYLSASVYFHPPDYGRTRSVEWVAFYRKGVQPEIAQVLGILFAVSAESPLGPATRASIEACGQNVAHVERRLTGWHSKYQREKPGRVDEANVYLLTSKSDSRTIRLPVALGRERGNPAGWPQGWVYTTVQRLQEAHSYEDWWGNRS
jgi:hypothetical protein